MEKSFVKLYKTPLFFPLWETLNIILGIILALILYLGFNYQLFKLIIFFQISVHVSAFLGAGIGFPLWYSLESKPILRALLIIIPAHLVTSLIACLIIYFSAEYIFFMKLINSPFDFFLKLYIPHYFIMVIYAVLIIVIDRLRIDKLNLFGVLNKTVPIQKKGINILDEGSHRIISYDEIIYLSSHGRKTVIHSEIREFENLKLIKEFEEKLPEDKFLRVHKQFIINRDFIGKIKYYSGGRYMAYLTDEEKSVIPIGKTYVAEIKKKLGIL